MFAEDRNLPVATVTAAIKNSLVLAVYGTRSKWPLPCLIYDNDKTVRNSHRTDFKVLFSL